MDTIFFLLIIALVITIGIYIYKKKQESPNNVTQENNNQIPIYQKKPLLTKTEIKFGTAIQKAIPDHYQLLPQINLATIIERKDNHKYQNELYRNIDFVIFDYQYNPILLIEINDDTHKQKARIARDIKVKKICHQANLPLITFWTEYGVNENYIEKRIKEYL